MHPVYTVSYTHLGGFERQLDGTSGRISHKASHAGKLFDLLVRTTGSGVRHHEDISVFIQTGKQGLCQLVIGCLPSLNNFFV